MQFSWAAVEETLKLVRAHRASFRQGPDAVAKARAALECRAAIVRFLCDLAADAGTTVSAMTAEQARECFNRRNGHAVPGVLDALETAAERRLFSRLM